MRLQHKKALVTGSSRGIGKSIALALAKEGCTVGVHYRDKIDEAQAVKLQIEESGGKAFIFQADLNNSAETIRLGETAWETLQGIDFLVNNAGISFKKHFLDFTEDDISYLHNVNYKAPFLLSQVIARQMVATHTEGCIYSITSVNGIRPNFGQSAYGASKIALETLMKGAALELAIHNIKVNTFAVGAIETDMTAEAIANPVFFKEVNEGIPMGRFGLPEEIAAVIVNLIHSGSYMTGSSITIDGGLLLMRGYGKTKKYNI
jgi:NAD(P)-dependent dehydrogenase (short-subunit alcohol dehydrogenase family)